MLKLDLREAPRDTPADLAERYRQLKDFDDAEIALVRACLRRPDRLPRTHEVTLRQALNLARLWVIPNASGGGELSVGPVIAPLRDRLRVLADQLIAAGEGADPATFGRDAEQLLPELKKGKESLLSRFAGQLLPSALDRELGQKALVLVLGGGGGCGYVHLGTFSVLERIGALPELVVGASLGAMLGLFRSRDRHYRQATVRAVTHGLSFKQLFRLLEQDSRFGLPGTMRLYLRSALSRFFVSPRGDVLRIGELAVPFVSVVTGIRREALRGEIADYGGVLGRELSNRGAFATLLHLKELATNWAGLIGDLIATPGAVRPVPIGIDSETQSFDVLDAVGFSCSVPALIHYDIMRNDPRAEELTRALLARHDVHLLVDGGVSANVPARFAWESVQRGRIGTRNTFILALDPFVPQLRRNMVFVPIQRIAAENVAKDRPFANHFFAYRQVPSPAALVPSPKALKEAIARGSEEFERESPFVQKMLEPLPPL